MRTIAALILVLAAACSADISNPVPAHDVSVGATVAGRGPAGDTINIRIMNSGTANAYLAQCGVGPLILTEQFVGGKWTGGVQNFMCPDIFTGPLVLAPGSSMNIVRVFDSAGRYRFLLSVATSSELSDSRQALSNGFDVR